MLESKSEKIFRMKYSRNGESWEDMCLRVASHIASVEGEEEQSEWTARFFQLMVDKVFLPGGRVLANAGTPIKNLMNCFVLPVEDTRQSIYEQLGNAAEIFAWGGGLGINYSNLRERGSELKTVNGEASGPLSFMELFNQTGEVIKQASRRGGEM